METQTITIELPRVVIEQVYRAADLLKTPVNDLFASTLSSSLPDLRDVPAEMQAELTRMTWLSDADLWEIAHAVLTDDEQTELHLLAQNEKLTASEQQRLEELRAEYGRILLRKARAYALLSLRGGKPLLA